MWDFVYVPFKSAVSVPKHRTAQSKPHWSSKPSALRTHLPCAGPQAREPDVGLKTLSPAVKLFSSLWVAHWGMWDLTIWRIHPTYPSPCGSFFMSLIVEDLFWWVSDFFVYGYSTDSCDFDVSVRRGEHRAFLLCRLGPSPVRETFSLLYSPSLWNR